MKKLFFLFVVALLLPVVAVAQNAVPAYVVDSKGPVTNIRTAPRANARVAMTLPTDKGSYEVLLGKVKNGWWRIEESIYEAEENQEIKLHGSKTGYWIHNSIVAFGVAGEQENFLRTKPSTRAPLVKVVHSDQILLHL